MSGCDALAELLEVMRRLRDPAHGCPWDRAQTFATIAPYTIEEAYEVADAIERGAPEELKDELGDLLFQIVFHARLAQERGWFDFAAVAAAIRDKLVRRHPHVFAAEELPASPGALNERWESHKERERAAAAERRGRGASGVLADVPLALPALTRATKLGKRAGRVGFDWLAASQVREKVAEELAELDAAMAASSPGPHCDASAPTTAAHREVVEELGDVLFALANLSRHLEVDPERALRAANTKFERRFAHMERVARERGIALDALSAPEWDALWRAAKRDEAGRA